MKKIYLKIIYHILSINQFDLTLQIHEKLGVQIITQKRESCHLKKSYCAHA